jgi:hypothetical protein
MHPPKTVGELPVLHWTSIDVRHRVTGACRHFNASTGSDDPTPSTIAIVGGGATGFYLMRFASGWQFITDTWHETLDEAFRQAEFEYEGVSNTWQTLAEPRSGQPT